jgi:hypothetical protein
MATNIFLRIFALASKLIADKTKQRRSTSFLRQSILMEVQRGNCVSILGTVESSKLLEELRIIFKKDVRAEIL